MQDSDKKRFATLLSGLADYYGKELSNGTIGLYWQGLQQFDIEAVEAALWAHTQNPDSGQFMPKIADIVRMVQGRTQDQALLAWAKVDRAVRTVGAHQDVVFDDPIIHRVIAEMGGWVWFGSQTDEEWPFVARNFENRYRAYRSRGEIPDYQPVLIGIANAHNQRFGHKAMPPVLIGNDAKAKEVMLGGSATPLIGVTRAEEQMKRIGQ